MEWRDIAPIALAVVIVLALSFVLKPMITEGDTDIIEAIPFLGGMETATPTAPQTPVPTPPPPTPVPTPTPEPTPTPRWDGSVNSVGFVNPETYHENLDENEYLSSPIPSSSTPAAYRMVTYATISGKWSGTTEIVNIPFPYWELHYTVETMTDPGYVYPTINIQVMDADDPNRFVRILNPGILDPRVWEDTDPRPWKEKFYEGEKNYYYIITTKFIESYTITIKVPDNFDS